MRPRRLEEGSGDAPCPATTAHLQATSEHAQLDFTGGYHNNERCQWDVQCDEAVALRFTAMDTESDYDFVSLYDGGDENAPQIAHLSGHGTSASTFAAAAGEMECGGGLGAAGAGALEEKDCWTVRNSASGFTLSEEPWQKYGAVLSGLFWQ